MMKFHLMIIVLLSGCFTYGTAIAEDDHDLPASQTRVKPSPILEQCPMPVYPVLQDSATNVKGRVIGIAVIDTAGNVKSWQTLGEAPKGLGFADAVQSALEEWKFSPGYWKGLPAEQSLALTFSFTDGKCELVANQSSDRQRPTLETTPKNK